MEVDVMPVCTEHSLNRHGLVLKDTVKISTVRDGDIKEAPDLAGLIIQQVLFGRLHRHMLDEWYWLCLTAQLNR